MISLKKLREIEGLEVLLSSWDEPRYGDRIYEILDGGIEYIQAIHRAILNGKTVLRSSDTMMVAAQVCKDLRLPETALNPLFFKTIEAHLRARDYQDLSGV